MKARKMTGSAPKVTTCTAGVGDGESCGNRDLCTRVITRSTFTGKTLSKHWVCGDCRRRMELPEFSIILVP